MTEVTSFNKHNADIEDFIKKSTTTPHDDNTDKKFEAGAETCEFHAYKEEPIMI